MRRAWASQSGARRSAHGLTGFRPRPGFTLIEVLVVVAIIALLASILLPSLQKAREQATGAVCRTNMHQIMLGMHTYVASEKVMPGSFDVLWTAFAKKYGGLPGQATLDPAVATTNWRPGDSWLGLQWPPQFDTRNPGVAEQLQQFVAARAPQRGSLYRYVRNEKAYLCPKDKIGKADPRDPRGGGGNGRFSYTMYGSLGFKPPEKSTSFTYVATFQQKPGALKAPITIPAGTKKQWTMSKMFSLAEEHPWNNINHGYVGDSWAADSYLAFRHHSTPDGGMGMFAFLDGHVEARRYPYFVRNTTVFPPTESVFQGLDLLNDYQIPYSHDGNTGGAANMKAWVHQFAYPY